MRSYPAEITYGCVAWLVVLGIRHVNGVAAAYPWNQSMGAIAYVCEGIADVRPSVRYRAALVLHGLVHLVRGLCSLLCAAAGFVRYAAKRFPGGIGAFDNA